MEDCAGKEPLLKFFTSSRADFYRIFIIEGLLTFVVGIIAKFWIVDWLETAKFLNNEERALLIAQQAADSGDATMNRLDKAATKRIMKDWKIYVSSTWFLPRLLLLTLAIRLARSCISELPTQDELFQKS